jgi:hypothetical protein
VSAHVAGLKIDGAARRVEQPRIGVPILGDGSVPPIDAGKTLDGRDGLGACHRRREPCRAFVVDDLGRGLAGDIPAKLDGVLGFIGLPALPVPDQPSPPEVDEAQIVLVAFGEAQRERIIRPGGRPILGAIRIAAARDQIVEERVKIIHRYAPHVAGAGRRVRAARCWRLW